MLLHADYPSSWRLTSAGTWEYSMGHSPSGCILNKDFMIKHVNFFLIETWRRVPTCLFILHVPVMAGPEVSQARAVKPRSQSRSPWVAASPPVACQGAQLQAAGRKNTARTGTRPLTQAAGVPTTGFSTLPKACAQMTGNRTAQEMTCGAHK